MLWKIPAPHARFPGFATLRFRSLDSDLRVGEYNGHQYPWIGWDELTEFPTSGPYLFIVGCNRSADGAPCRIRASGNPGRPGHGWVKPRFIDVARPFEIYLDPETGLTRCFIPSKLEDNQILMCNDPDYERTLLLMPAHLRKALRYGDWDVIVGQVFSEYSKERHVIKRTPLDDTWARFASLDWGYAKPFSIGWWAVSRDGRMIRYKEWYGCETDTPNSGLRMSAGQVAAKAWEMSVDEGVNTIVADPACWTKIGLSDASGAVVPSVAETFEQAGFTMIKANNDRVNGLARLHDMLTLNGQDGRPMLLVTENCRAWQRTVPYLTADPRNPEDIDTALEDHCFPDGTMIATPCGPCPIESLKRGDRVLTREGPRRLLDVWHEGEHKTVIAHFSNGVSVEATPAHKVWVEGRGFVRIDEMRHDDVVLFMEAPCELKQSSTTGSPLGDTLIPSEKRTEDTSSHLQQIGAEALNHSTAKSGRKSAARFPLGIMSIIKTRILGIMRLKTSSASRGANTNPCILEDRSRIRGVGARMRRPGIILPQGKPGTRSEGERIGKGGNQQSAPALSVAKNMKAGRLENQNTARPPVRRARFVGLTQGTTRNVHDLSVEGIHEYFAGGLLVSNCYDDTRYAIMSEYALDPRGLRRPKVLHSVGNTRKEYDPLRVGL